MRNFIQEEVYKYLSISKVKCVVIGISGGFDSAFNAALLKPVCDELGIPIIGRYIHIESNKLDEKVRACAIGKYFCHEFKCVDLTNLYQASLDDFEEGELVDGDAFDTKIRRGNIKARLRMIHLYNLAGWKKGLVIDNDNMTERKLGFWTINGAFLSTIEDENARAALKACIDCIPTDGLGITSSDVEQFGCKTYNEVDDILKHHIMCNPTQCQMRLEALKRETERLVNTYGEDVVTKVVNRHLNSEFKRHLPVRILG